VADRSNSRIEKFTAGGAFLARWGNRGAGAGELIQPAGLTVDCRGDVIVADAANNRLQRFRGVAPAGACAAYAGFAAPAAPPPPPPPPPVLTVGLPRRSGVLGGRGLVVAIRCDRACRVSAGGRLSPAGGSPRTVLSAVPRTLRAGVALRVKLHLTAPGVRLMQRALGKRRGLRALVTVTATGAGGTAARPFVANYHVTR
jgi:hypothetical protein